MTAKISPQPSALSHNFVLVSIIIPAYNTARYIHRAIQSSLNQTHTKIEVLVIDDGSTDGTLQVARSFVEKDNRVRVFSQKNSGVSVARNRGITEARGEYIVFLDSDDWMEDDCVEVLLDAQEKYPGAMITANFWRVDEKSSEKTAQNAENIPSQYFSLDEAVEAQVNGKIEIYGLMYTKLFSASLIRERKLTFKEGMPYSEDLLFSFTYLLEAGKCFYVSKPLMNYLQRFGSVVNSSYSPVNTRSIIYTRDEIIRRSPNEKVRRLSVKAKFSSLVYALEWALKFGAGKEEIAFIRRNLAEMYHEVSSKLTFKQKVGYLVRMYMPVNILRATISIRRKLSSLR